ITMANFTVEWLCQSYYRYTEETHLHDEEEEEVHKNTEEFTEEPKHQYSPTSPNNSCGYSSSSDSEAGDESDGEAAQNPRMRTKFTSEQIRKLENTFSEHKYLGSTQRRRIAHKLNLSETQVNTWFQNRRMKMKREIQDMRTEFLTVPTALLPPLLFQHHGLSGQLPVIHIFCKRLVYKCKHFCVILLFSY
uniref:Homeobox domain-containing protein n=1 Tax=Sphaeramia orbicularis TaxID=375764 RepID=A0A673CCR0_9TELE